MKKTFRFFCLTICMISILFPMRGYAASHWNCDIHAYQYDMTVYLDLKENNIVLDDYSDFEIAAFYKDECRGTATVVNLNENGKSVVRLRVRSNTLAGDTLKIKVYQQSSNKEQELSTKIVFNSMAVIGAPSIPIETPIEETTEEVYLTDSPKLRFVADGEVIKEEALDYGSVIIVPNAPDKEGYTFISWGEVLNTMPAHDVTYTAEYKVNQYKVTFVADGVVIKEDMLDYGSEISLPNNPVKEGYAFISWGDVEKTVPSHDVTYTATFSANAYKITYILDGTEYKSMMVEFGSALAAIEPPVKEGYTFSGWSEIPSTMPAKELVITGTYSINQYKVTFIADGVTVKEESLDYGSSISIPNAPEKEGHTFISWGEVDQTIPAHDVTYTAEYKVNQYKVTFIADGVIVKEDMLDYGSEINIPEPPEKEGYIFSSWGEVDKTVPPYNITYTAEYIKYSIKGDVNGDNHIDISDVVAVINHIAGITNWEHADVNNDNHVDISDVVKIINIIAGLDK